MKTSDGVQIRFWSISPETPPGTSPLGPAAPRPGGTAPSSAAARHPILVGRAVETLNSPAPRARMSG